MNLFKKGTAKKENKKNSMFDMLMDENSNVTPYVYMFMNH